MKKFLKRLVLHPFVLVAIVIDTSQWVFTGDYIAWSDVKFIRKLSKWYKR